MGKSLQTPEVTVLITAHNEAEQIEPCLHAILEQNFPMERVEILLIDDRSTDRTAEYARRMCGDRLRVVRIDHPPERLTTRQVALDTGIRMARGEVVLITDVDGRVPREWIHELTGHLSHRDGAVSAPVIFAGGWRVMARYQTLDALVRFTLYRWANRHGLASGLVGANLAVRRSAYLQSGGLEAVGFAPAEDLALGAALSHSGWTLRYLTRPVVRNEACRRVSELIARDRRRVRHGARSLTLITLAYLLVNWLLIGLAVALGGIWMLLLVVRYLVGMFGIVTAVTQYGSLRLLKWVYLYEPLILLQLTWVYLSNLVRPRLRWGGQTYDRRGPIRSEAAAERSSGSLAE